MRREFKALLLGAEWEQIMAAKAAGRQWQFMPIHKEMKEAKPTRKKKATKKSLKALVQFFAK